MRDAMVRNTRAVVALKLPRRHAMTIRVDGAEGERRPTRSSPQRRAGWRPRQRQKPARAAPSARRRRIVSGRGAAAVRRFAARHADEPGWRVLAQRSASAGNGGKEAALLELLRRNPDEKKLVFVHYRETLDHLAELLARAGFGFARFEVA